MSFTDDTTMILNDSGETLTVQRDSPSYSAGMAAHSWAGIGTVAGVWQPLSGSQAALEASREVKSEAVIFTAINVDVQEGDKIIRADGSFMYVNYIKKYECHWEILLKANK